MDVKKDYCENDVVKALVSDSFRAVTGKTSSGLDTISEEGDVGVGDLDQEDTGLGGTVNTLGGCTTSSNGHSVTFDIDRKEIPLRVDQKEGSEIEEDIMDAKEADFNQTGHFKNDDFDDSISENSSISSRHSSATSSSTSSYSSRSSLDLTKPPRLAQTFKVGDLTNELNKTRTIPQRKSPRLTSGTVSIKNTVPKVNSWIDPKKVKGTENDSKKVETWISQKEEEKKRRLKKERQVRKEKLKQEQEERDMKQKLEKKNFEQWESKKKELLEQKMKKSAEMKKRKEEKEREKIEKEKDCEKTFTQWKANKEDHLKKDRFERRQREKEKREESERLAAEKERNCKKVFDKWCDRRKELEEKQKAAQKEVQDAEAELKLLEDYRRCEAEEEYIRWKKEKRSCTSPEIVKPAHPLGWAPAGKSDGRNRRSTDMKPAAPGAPLSKTLANLKGSPNYHRRLKTIDVCCRQISFWCHCPPDQTTDNGHCNDTNGHYRDNVHDDTFQRSLSHPVTSSTPNHSPRSSRLDLSRNLSENDHHGLSTLDSSRPSSTRTSRPSSSRSSRASTPRRY